MPTPANPTALAQQARRSYVERLLAGMPAVVQAIDQGAKMLAAAVAEPAVALKRRELAADPARGVAALAARHDDAAARGARHRHASPQTRLGELPPCTPSNRTGAKLSLVDDDTDRARDPQLAARAGDDGPRVVGVHRPALAHEHRSRAARSWTPTTSCARTCWRASSRRSWLRARRSARRLATAAGVRARRSSRCFAEEAYHEINRFLLERHVLPEIDLRPFIRRSTRRRSRRLQADPTPGGGFGSARPAVRSGAGSAIPARRRARPRARDDARSRERDAADDARRRPGARPRSGRGRAEPAQPPRRPPAARIRRDLARAGAAVAAPERGDRRGAGERRPSARRRASADAAVGAGQHAGAGRGAAAAQAGAQAGGHVADRARDDRDRRAAVPEHPDGGRDPGDGARLVRAPADAGAARRRLRARLLRHRRASGAPADRPHGLRA